MHKMKRNSADKEMKKEKRTEKKQDRIEKNSLSILKVISLLCIAILIANIILFSSGVYSALIMWAVIIIIALIAFPGMKILKRKFG